MTVIAATCPVRLRIRIRNRRAALASNKRERQNNECPTFAHIRIGAQSRKRKKGSDLSADGLRSRVDLQEVTLMAPVSSEVIQSNRRDAPQEDDEKKLREAEDVDVKESDTVEEPDAKRQKT